LARVGCSLVSAVAIVLFPAPSFIFAGVEDVLRMGIAMRFGWIAGVLRFVLLINDSIM
jgi:hypothetical protein